MDHDEQAGTECNDCGHVHHTNNNPRICGVVTDRAPNGEASAICACSTDEQEINRLNALLAAERKRHEEREAAKDAEIARLALMNERLVEAWEDRYQKLRNVHAAADKCIPIVREVAKAHGYAIGVHGSLARDIDLIAAPWSEAASEPLTLVEAICGAVGGYVRPDEESAELGHGDRNPSVRPHGRLTWSIWVAGGTYLDFSVMPMVGALHVADKKDKERNNG